MWYVACRRPAPRYINTDWNRWIEFATPRYNVSDVDWMAVNRKNLAAAAVVASNRR
jgi:hypothetical protein